MSPINNTKWKGVPLHLIECWNKTFQGTRETLNISAPCPVCGASTLHRWYQVGEPIDRIVQGQRFVAKGGLWEWCSTCHAYSHASAFVPDWWECHLEVNITALTAEPEEIERARLEHEK